MANTRISDLTASTSNLASTDLAPVVQTVGVGPVKMTGAQIAAGLLSATTPIGSGPILSRAAAATLQLGAADTTGTTAPTAQFLRVQSWSSSTNNNQTGADFTIQGSRGTGTGAGGSIIFQVAPAGSSGTAQNSYISPLQVLGTGGITGVDGATANTLALRNGTNAQEFRVYNTYTDATTNEYARILWSGNSVIFGSGKTGTGILRTVYIQGGSGGSGLYLNGTNAADHWNINTSGMLLAATDNLYDIGASGTSRPRNLYLGGSITLGGTSITGASGGTWGTPSVVQLAAGGHLQWNGRTRIYSAADGSITLYNNATTGFTSIQFGGTDATFPALKRSSASLICRLADDSANAAFEALSLKTSAPAGGTSGTWKVGVYNATAPSATGYVEVDIGGTLYKLLAST